MFQDPNFREQLKNFNVLMQNQGRNDDDEGGADQDQYNVYVYIYNLTYLDLKL